MVLLQLNVTVFADSHGKLHHLREEDGGWAGGGRVIQNKGWEELWLDYKINKNNKYTHKERLTYSHQMVLYLKRKRDNLQFF